MDEAQEARQPEPDYSIPRLRIQTHEPAAPWALVVKSAERLEGWAAYQLPKHPMDAYVETIIHYAKQYYRIGEEEQVDQGWVYRLNPLPRGEPLVNVVELNREAFKQAEERVKERRDSDRRDRIAPIYELLIGFLPRRVLEELSLRWGFDPEEASRKNAFLQFCLCFVLTMLGIAFTLAGGYTGRSIISAFTAWIPLALTLEGVIRWAHVHASNEPLGLFALEIADRFGQRLRRR
jgi:hypothetical protein